ncbi:hypothetical protein Salat_0854400 [Sesamum alatum]|uniref:Uncharacterized protein n=1 Tax=Sesamum alatum TaxID=300844 RepID=A0AAE2CQM2_9LAMI|nr:hypothetical protein Salat_0854400 [Sesamum alatum]
MQATAFDHNLSLKCSMFYHDKAIADQKICDLHKDLTKTQQREKEALDTKVALEAKIADLEAQFQQFVEEAKIVIADALERGKSEGFSAGGLAGKIEGLSEGRELDVVIQSARFLNDGFDKCISQVDNLKGFAEGFDKSHLDPSLDADFSPIPRKKPRSQSQMNLKFWLVKLQI